MLTENFVDAVVVADLAAAAKQGVIDASLAPRSDTPPACALPTTDFEPVCVEIDKAQDTTAAALAATDAMLASVKEARTRRLSAAAIIAFDRAISSDIPRVGIGIEYALLDIAGDPCETPSDTCRMVILEVYAKSPAEAAGLKAGDILLEYDQPIAGLSCSAALNLDQSQNFGSTVTVKVLSSGTEKELDIVTAEVIDPVLYSQVVDGNVGYLQYDAFSRASDNDFQDHLSRLIKAGVDALVVDLRNNGGGYVTEAQRIIEQFLEQKDLVSRLTSVRGDEVWHSPQNGIAADAIALPMAVAVNGRSASASEMFALAMRGHQRAKIVGTKTYGKYTGQSTRRATAEDRSSLGAIQVTSILFFGPNNLSAKGGIEPDLVSPMSACLHPIGVVRESVVALYPRVTGLAFTSVPTKAAYSLGDAVTVAVTFDTPIEVDTTNGSPTLTLQIGSNSRQATYSSVSTSGGTSVLEFAYTVATDSDNDGISIAANAIALNGATINRVTVGWDAVLEHPLLADDPTQTVSATSSTVTSPPTVTVPTISTPTVTTPKNPTPTVPTTDSGHPEEDTETDETTDSDTDPESDEPEPEPAPEPEPEPETEPEREAETDEPAPDRHFDDIADSSFIEAINWLADQNIASGCGPTSFCPNHPVTRAQMAAFLSRALQLQPTQTDYFTDDNTSTLQDHINRIRQANITSGCSPTSFCPNQPITRAQMAALLSRALQLQPTQTDYFTDDNTSTLQDHINRIRQANITTGCSPTSFCPNQPITRAQVAALLFRARELIEAQRITTS